MPIYCAHDSTQHPDDALYCMKCGEPLGARAISFHTTSQATLPFDEAVHSILFGTMLAKRGTVRIRGSSLTATGLKGGWGTPPADIRVLPVEVLGIRNPHDASVAGLWKRSKIYGIQLIRRESPSLDIYCETPEQRDRLAAAVDAFLG